MSGQPIGHLVDALGVRHTPVEGELVDGVVVLLHCITPDGRALVRTAWSDGMSWVTRRGLLEVALDSERVPPAPDDGGDD